MTVQPPKTLVESIWDREIQVQETRRIARHRYDLQSRGIAQCPSCGLEA